jgi:hypothetical protein
MPSKRATTSVNRKTDRLLHRIRTLVQETDRADGAGKAIVRGQKREIEQLKSQLAEIVKRNPTGLDDGPAGAETKGVQR